MQDQLTRGLSAPRPRGWRAGTRRATPHTRWSPDRSPRTGPDRGRRGHDTGHYRALQQALEAYDESEAQQALDAMLRELSLTTVLRDIVMPYLAELGARWETGTIDVAQEHFASNLLRGRLAGLALGWGQGVGPRAVLACPQGELHDLPLMVFGIMLNRSGWRVTFLGNNTPVSDLTAPCTISNPRSWCSPPPRPRRSRPKRRGWPPSRRGSPSPSPGPGPPRRSSPRRAPTALRGDPVTEALRLEAPHAVPVPAGAGS